LLEALFRKSFAFSTASAASASAIIAAYWLNRRVVRFHPRAILAKMAKDNGMAPDLISAMFGESKPN
jgi:hypothetical protein